MAMTAGADEVETFCNDLFGEVYSNIDMFLETCPHHVGPLYEAVREVTGVLMHHLQTRVQLYVIGQDDLADRQETTRAITTSAEVITDPITSFLEAYDTFPVPSHTTTCVSMTSPATYTGREIDSCHEDRAGYLSPLRLSGDLIDSPRQSSLMIVRLSAEEDSICNDTTPNARKRSRNVAKLHRQHERREERENNTGSHGRRRGSTRNRLRKEVSFLSQRPINFNRLTYRFSKETPKHIDFLERFTASLATPEAFSQLTATLDLVRNGDSLRLPPDSSPVAAKMSHLDTTGSLAAAGMMLRRFGLMQLRKHHKTVEFRISHEPVSGRKNSAVLDCMLEELCSALGASWNKEPRKKLKNLLSAGKNWETMAHQFGVGSICLAPSGGEQSIWNQSLENIPEAVFLEYMTILDDSIGKEIRSFSDLITAHIEPILHGVDKDSRFKFEKLEEDELRDAMQDDLRYQDLCNLQSQED